MKFLLSYLIVVLSVLSSCEKAPKCWGKSNVNAGEIIADTTLCANCTFLANENIGFVIKSEADLNRIHATYFRKADECVLNTFNLSKYTLLGVATLTKCNYKIKKKVTIDDNLKTYFYDIEIDECGNCDGTNYRSNWVIIPKIKPGYQVNFRIFRIPK